MKCIKCGTDNNLKDRTANNGRCKSCKHRFTFDPKASKEITFTDPFFANTIRLISAENTLFFTPRQFYYFFNGRKNKQAGCLQALGCLLIFIGAIGCVILLIETRSVISLFMLLFLFAGIALLVPAVQRRLVAGQPKKATVAPHQVNQWLDRWKRANGSVPKLLPPPATSLEPARVNPDVQAYSFDRLIVCERESVAQFLIANNFHFEHNCAVLAIDGYPHNLFDTVMRMLRRNPALKVYALHNATPSGVHLVHRLMTDPKWFKESSGVTVYDLGLLPRQVMNRRMFIEQSEGMAEQARKGMAPEVRHSLRPDEIKWLEEGYHVDLESIPPKQLLRVITLGIAKSRDPQADDTLVPVYGGYSDGGGAIYASDSFG
ncbi:MAG TPA: hypothetical protein VNO70_21255 [Blastocatellia bacterium]|nr:hypothetical protein [Blastocatellia bacterium]